MFLHCWTIAGRTGNCQLSWISWVQSCPGKPSLGFFMPLGLSSLFLHLCPSEVQHRGKQEEPAQRRWGCADLLLPGRGWPHVSAQLPGFPQEKEQIWSNVSDHAVGTGTLAMVRRREECWKPISMYVSPALVPSAFPQTLFSFLLSPSPALLHTVSLATSPPGIGREAGEGMGGVTLWEPAATSPSPCLNGIVQNKETQSENVWVLHICQK